MEERQPISDELVTHSPEINLSDEPATSQSSESIPNPQQPVIIETPGLTLGARVRRWLGISRDARSERLAELNRTITTYPEAGVNYVLRGEIFAEMGEYALAKADFEQGLMLAEAQFETSDWGFMAQTVRDRALVGLDKTRRKLG